MAATDSNKEECKVYLQKAKLNEEQIELLTDMGYFVAPASSQYHNSFDGGLYLHSMNVADIMLNLNLSMGLGVQDHQIYQMAMLHDVEKSIAYEGNILKNGKRSDAKPYKRTNNHALGHTNGGLYIVMQELKLELDVDVLASIAHHHMLWDHSELSRKGIMNDITSQPLTPITFWLLKSADEFCSWVLENDKVKTE